MGIFDKYEQATDKLQAYTAGLLSSKGEFLAKQALNFVLVFVVFVISGCFDFVKFAFEFELLGELRFWGESFGKTIEAICMFNIGINLLWESEIKKNNVLNENIQKYNELLTRKQLDFEYYVTKVFNPEEKKKAYKSFINRKIYFLNKFAKPKDKLLYSSEMPEKQQEKLKNKYCIKRKELEELKSDEYIDKNIESLNVKYKEVDPAVFELEIDGSISEKGVKTKGNVTLGKVKASSNVAMGTLAVAIFTTMIGVSADQEEFIDDMVKTWHYIWQIMRDVVILLWQLLRGMLRTRKIVSSELTDAFAGRIIVLSKYLEWRLTNNVPDTKLYVELKKDENVVEVEMSQEDLQQYFSKNKEE